jgi:hypothetical protein
MTSIGVTDRIGNYNRTTEAHDWKRRSERLVRASGLPYTVACPTQSCVRAGSTTTPPINTAGSKTLAWRRANHRDEPYRHCRAA